MRTTTKLFSALIVAALPAMLPAPVSGGVAPEPVSLVRVEADARDLGELSESFDLTEHGRDGAYDVVLHPGDRLRLDALGLPYAVVVDDLVAKDIRDRIAESRAQREDPETRLVYRTLADYEQGLERLAARAPGLVRTFSLPSTTAEGRLVHGAEMSADIDRARVDGRPTVMIDGLHHAREWPSGELTIMFAQDLVDSYLARDAEIVDLLSEVRVIVVPVVNPDGFVRSRETVSDFIAPAPGVAAFAGEFAYHRKNLRANTAVGKAYGFELQQGVDVNRNYTFLWSGPGASGSPDSQTYHGPGPGSEAETENVESLIESEQVVGYITNHTYSDLILRPWGHMHTDAPDETLLRELGDDMAAHNGYTSQKSIDLYPTTGTAEDWVYAVSGALGYTFEIGSSGFGLGNVTPAECAGFHPQYNVCIPSFYELNRPAYLELLRAARDPATHVVLEGTAPAGTTLELTKDARLPLSGGGHAQHRLHDEIVVSDEGTFTWHVNPSPLPSTVDAVRRGNAEGADLEAYTLTATLPDGTTQTRTLVAERGERYRLDFGS